MNEFFSSLSWMHVNNNYNTTSAYNTACLLVKDGYNRVDWIYSIFGECVHTPKEQFAFWIGILSICFWCFASLPQILTNYRNRSATGLSLGLLVLWASGDGTNLLACMLLQPLFMQVTIASYYVVTDTILIWQYFYYKSVDHQRRNGLRQQVVNEIGDEFIDANHHRTNNHHHRTRIRSLLLVVLLIVPSTLFVLSSGNSTTLNTSSLVASAPALVGRNQQQQKQETHLFNNNPKVTKQSNIVTSIAARKLLSSETMSTQQQQQQQIRYMASSDVQQPSSITATATTTTTTTSTNSKSSESRYQWPPRGFRQISGYIIACICSVLYLAARVPQMYQNCRRGSTRGMNPLLFFCTIMGNFTYAMSICLYSSERGYLLFQIPWLVGSLGVLLLDMAILGQVILFEFLVPKFGGGGDLLQDQYRLVMQDEEDEADLESDSSLQL